MLRLNRLVLIVFSMLASKALVCEVPTQRRMVIVIASYNNAQWYERNLISVCNQDYDNYRVIYVNDCSPDDTGRLVREFLQEHNLESLVELRDNPERRRALRNLYDAIVSCDDEEIIVLVDGDDQLSGNGVLRVLNAVYADPNIWLTYGQFICYPSNALGFNKETPLEVIANNSIRSYNPQPSHLRTFYAKLFKMIAVEDFMYEGDFFPMTYDLAMMLPMMEMAGHHHKFIPDVLYIYNDANPINDHKVSRELQQKLDGIIRGRNPYQKLDTLF